MIERVFRFGPNENLLGVLTEPDCAQARSDTPASLCLNAGVLHHVGPLGWYATLARRLAGQGILSLRFDLAGVGDSPIPKDHSNSLDGAALDVADAMDFLTRKRKKSHFVLVGL